jgi:hypothetical protein
VVTADLTAPSPELGNDPLLTPAGPGHLMTGHDNKAMSAQTAAANSPVFCEGAPNIRAESPEDLVVRLGADQAFWS